MADNLIGLCHAIGDAFGFNPLYLRIVLAAMLVLNWQVAIGVYAICGLAVMTSALAIRRSDA